MNVTNNETQITEALLAQLKSTVLTHAQETDKLCAAAAQFLEIEEANIDYSDIISNINDPLYRLLIQMLENYDRLATAFHDVCDRVVDGISD